MLPVESSAPIFIGYRRRDTQGFAGRLADDLEEIFGEGRVFRDDDIEAGTEFAGVLDQALEACRVLVVVIGPGWVDATDTEGARRLDDPRDWVRREVETALSLGTWLLPVLVGRGRMPRRDELPTSMTGLLDVQALEMSDRRWEDDLGRLVDVLHRRLPDVAPLARSRDSPVRRPLDVVARVIEAARRTGGRPVRSMAVSERLVRWLWLGLRRLAGLAVLLFVGWFLLENYASPEVRQGVADFVAFTRDKAGELWSLLGVR